MQPLESLASLAFRHRSAVLLPAAGPILLGLLQPAPPDATEALLGLSLAGAGVATRLWAVRAIGKRARVRHAGAKQLLLAGPYARVRNPLYVGNAALTLGLAVLAGAGWSALVSLAVLVVVYALVVRHEEGVLAGQFGDEYAAFRAAVPRWLPRLRPTALTGAPCEPWPWPEVLRREVSPLLGVPAAGATLLVARAGLLPLEPWVGAALEATGLSLEALLAVALGLAVMANALSTEAKLRRHAGTRAPSVLAGTSAAHQRDSMDPPQGEQHPGGPQDGQGHRQVRGHEEPRELGQLAGRG